MPISPLPIPRSALQRESVWPNAEVILFMSRAATLLPDFAAAARRPPILAATHNPVKPIPNERTTCFDVLLLSRPGEDRPIVSQAR
jgi:hypothetical protein